MPDPTSQSGPLVLAPEADADPDGATAAQLTRRTALTVGTNLCLLALGLNLAEAEDAAAADGNTQGGWRLCTRCGGMTSSPKKKAVGHCPAGGKHTPRKDASYLMIRAEGITADSGMSAAYSNCKKCTVLFGQRFNDQGAGVCPRGGTYERSSTSAPRFQVWTSTPVPVVMETNWRLCAKCSGMFKLIGSASGVCPQDGGAHDAYANPLLCPIILT